MPRRKKRGLRTTLLALVLLAGWVPIALSQNATDVRIGNWVELKGRFERGQFFADSIEVLEPEDEESIVGTVTKIAEDQKSFTLLGRRITVSERTRWRDLSIETLLGTRVKVEGHYRGPRKFSSREISRRRPGRERINGRVDDVRRVDYTSELRVMNFTVNLPSDLRLDHDRPLDEYRLVPSRPDRPDAGASVRRRDDDDNIPATVTLADDLQLGLLLEWQGRHEGDFNLDRNDEEDRRDNRLSGRGELIWRPSRRLYGLVGFSYQKLFRDDENDGYSRPDDGQLREAYAYVRDVGLTGLDLQVGRQDFDEEREWIYDQVLDAARAHYTRESWKLELSASSFLADGSPRNEATDNLLAYISTVEKDRHLAAYVLDRRDPRGGRDYPVHFGVRALGEWLPDNDIWFETSVLQGYNDGTDLRGYGFDIGTTWSPDFLGPVYLNAGYAFGSGDANDGGSRDRNFRQSGLQDNTDKLGGVTSFKYYGELFDPELSNMGILTLGIGTRIGRRNSIDLIYHRYRQDEATNNIRDSDIDRRPTGLDTDIGWEVDLIFGSRAWKELNIEVVLAAFEPGGAFARRDTAYMAKFQVRWRL